MEEDRIEGKEREQKTPTARRLGRARNCDPDVPTASAPVSRAARVHGLYRSGSVGHPPCPGVNGTIRGKAWRAGSFVSRASDPPDK